jgi:hypothetical protein
MQAETTSCLDMQACTWRRGGARLGAFLLLAAAAALLPRAVRASGALWPPSVADGPQPPRKHRLSGLSSISNSPVGSNSSSSHLPDYLQRLIADGIEVRPFQSFSIISGDRSGSSNSSSGGSSSSAGDGSGGKAADPGGAQWRRGAMLEAGPAPPTAPRRISFQSLALSARAGGRAIEAAPCTRGFTAVGSKPRSLAIILLR